MSGQVNGTRWSGDAPNSVEVCEAYRDQLSGDLDTIRLQRLTRLSDGIFNKTA
jgi:hypothetical protein